MEQKDIEKTENKIIVIREQRVILDRDVAELYGVETKRINEALKNNPKKFPDGYVIELTNSAKTELVEKFDRFKSMRHSTVAPHAFTEKGLYMLATILKSPVATEVTIAIIETFTKLRQFTRILGKTNMDAQEGIMPDASTIDHLQDLSREMFEDPLPRRMRKLAFSLNVILANFSLEIKDEYRPRPNKNQKNENKQP